MAWPIVGGSKKNDWEKKVSSEKGPQEQTEGHKGVGVLPGWGKAGKMLGHGYIGVFLIGCKPLLETAPAVPVRRARLEGVAPDLLTQVSRGGEIIWERAAKGPCWTTALPCGGDSGELTPQWSPPMSPSFISWGSLGSVDLHPDWRLQWACLSPGLCCITYLDSSPSLHASWICKCKNCCSQPTTPHSPPGTAVRPELALPDPVGPPECR